MTLNKTLGTAALAVTLAAGLAQTASALDYDLNALYPNPPEKTVVAGNDTGLYGTPLYKTDQVAPSTDFSSSVAGLEAIITALTGPWNITYVTLKAGNDHILWTLPPLTIQAGDRILVENDALFVGNPNRPNLADISHVSIYGEPGTVTVPDGGSMAVMLGAGLLAFGALRRR